MFKKHWVSDLERRFPQGVDTPGLMLIKVRAPPIRYRDGDGDKKNPDPVARSMVLNIVSSQRPARPLHPG